jgi:hypothetical protein
MHTREVENLKPVAVDLFKVLILFYLSAENLFEIVVLAYKYGCEQLKNIVRSFLSTNSDNGYFTNLIKRNQWVNFMN